MVHRIRHASGWRRVALIAMLALGSSCAAGSRPSTLAARAAQAAPAAPAALEVAEAPPLWPVLRRGEVDPVVLVTLDGVRWQEIFEGTDASLTMAPPRGARELVPNLHRLSHERGAAVGAPGRGTISATGPHFVSLPGYTEIFTGRAPRECQDNDCHGVETPTLLDDAVAAGATAAAFGSWERLDRAVTSKLGSFTVSCGRHGDPAIDPWPGSGDFRPDRITAELALGHLASARPDVMFVGLGEPDEYAHHGDYAGYLRSLREADAFVGKLLDTLARMGPRGARTHVIVTADHGRARDFKGHGGWAPESARVWLVATGPSIAARGLQLSPTDRHLADVAPTLRAIVGLSPAPSDRSSTAARGRVLDELFAPQPPELSGDLAGIAHDDS